MSRKIMDAAVYTSVQPHYIATPIFEGFDDPLKKRSGFLKGFTDIVKTPDISTEEKAQKKAVEKITEAKPITTEQFEKIVDWACEHEPGKGERNRFWGAIAGFLKRQGILDEEVGEIVYEAACAANDEEAKNRQQSALNACYRIDSGMAMTGLQTLVKDFGIEDIDQITKLIGTRKIDPEEMIEDLNDKSSAIERNAIFNQIVGLSHSETEKLLKKMAFKTDITLGSLKKDLATIKSNMNKGVDFGEIIARDTLSEHFSGGENLIYIGKRYLGYNRKFWEDISGDYIAGLILPFAERVLKSYSRVPNNLSDLVGQANRIIRWRSAKKGDALRMLEKPYPVINTPDAEIWLPKDGSIKTLPHHPDSFQLGCIKINYNPNAKCPKFDKAVLEIFANNDQPKEMQRLLYEVMGYAIQPNRDIAAFCMMIGNSNCGKSKIAETMAKLLGDEAVIHLKLESFEKDKDAIGNLFGKRLVIEDDVTRGVKFPDGVIKMISETKRLTGELKYANKFSFLSYALVLIIGNHFPRIFEADYSITRRAVILPFKRTFDPNEDDKDLFDKIWSDKQEMSGILNRCIEGYQRLRKRGRFELPKECKYAYDEWVSGCTFVAKFINEICVSNDGVNQTWQDHIKSLYEWADAEDIKVNMTPKEIRRIYETSGIKFGSTGGVLTIKNIKAPELF